ncbi:YciI family protein [Gordonia hankookensis]|uniref:YciI family protein n=1 Tax=Gordonia hankookensis TaxID=589403 RepID=A0ABR7W9I5_9ACTN|nr:YciI family protein [Gordonia hankookensis]MBD1318482.1 YciI family protein [Gordonia hankookensis]NDZ94016.1 YciI family protein [Streptomyces sp. SID11726]NEB25334.1 YciI family protein [Streptomyces sp. SID6673]
MRYALLINNAEPAPGEVTAEAVDEMKSLIRAYTDALYAAGVLVAAEILASPTATQTVTRRDGDLRVQEGPFAETREALAGVFVIDVPDHDAALAWTEKMPATQYAVVEVRRSVLSCVDGVWSD